MPSTPTKYYAFAEQGLTEDTTEAVPHFDMAKDDEPDEGLEGGEEDDEVHDVIGYSVANARQCRFMPPRFCLMCYESVVLRSHNVCPSCDCESCLVDTFSDLASRTRQAATLSSGVKVLGNELLQDIAEYMRQVIDYRSNVKVEDNPTDHFGPPSRRVGFDSTGTEAPLVFSGVVDSEGVLFPMAMPVTFDAEAPVPSSPEETAEAGAPSAKAEAADPSSIKERAPSAKLRPLIHHPSKNARLQRKLGPLTPLVPIGWR